MAGKLIYGIQQLGLGVADAEEAMKWYAKVLRLNIKIFDDSNEATYMAPYMGGVAHEKRAIMVMNAAGGSGLELWQYQDKTPASPAFDVLPGDIGINYAIIKSSDIQGAFRRLTDEGAAVISEVKRDSVGRSYFFVRDPYGNLIQISESSCFYTRSKSGMGGLIGCALGVSDIDESLAFYTDKLGYSEVEYDEVVTIESIGVGSCSEKIRRVCLKAPGHSDGRFGKFLGESHIELIQRLDSPPRHIFENRHWGDLGYIHLCFEVYNLEEWVETCKDSYPFTVLSDESFAMGEANGRWGYLEDRDGILIEFVETCRIPIIKLLNWYNNLQEKSPEKPLAAWLVKALSLKRIRV